MNDNFYLDKKFGKLTVIKRVENDKHRNRQFLCICDCENKTEKIIRARDLKNGKIKSCGCLNYKHNMSHSRIYRIFIGMKYRCNNPNSVDFERYGGRGIKICDEWERENGFELFYNWSINNGYNDSLTIDRIDNNKNYEPSNCRWATMSEQGKNKSNNNLITINGKTQTLSEWANEYKLDKETIRNRFVIGDTGLDLIRKPYEKRGKINDRKH